MGGVYGGVGSSNVTGGGLYFKEGLYRVKLKACKAQRSQRGGGVFSVIETEVLESTNGEIEIGSHPSQVISMGNVMGPVNVKQFVCTLFGVDAGADNSTALCEAAVSEIAGRPMNMEQICEWVFGDSNPVADEVLDLECFTIITKQDKKPFTKHVWHTLGSLKGLPAVA